MRGRMRLLAVLMGVILTMFGSLLLILTVYRISDPTKRRRGGKGKGDRRLVLTNLYPCTCCCLKHRGLDPTPPWMHDRANLTLHRAEKVPQRKL